MVNMINKHDVDGPKPWYAIRTGPGAQMPQRDYERQPTKSKQGYRLVSSLDRNVSAVEKSLTRAGFVHYMPVMTKVVRNRRKTGDFSTHRNAMLQGYVFVYGVTNWPKLLTETPGVQGVVAINGEPLPIRVSDIVLLRTIEAASEALADEQIEKLRLQEAREERKQRSVSVAAAKRRYRAGSRVRVLWGDAVGRGATVTGWGADGRLQACLSSSLGKRLDGYLCFAAAAL